MGPLRDRSPVHGLVRRRLGPADVVAQSIAGSAPSAAMAATPVIVAGLAGYLLLAGGPLPGPGTGTPPVGGVSALGRTHVRFRTRTSRPG